MSRRANREGSVYKRKDGRWVGVVDLGWENGRRRRKSVYGRTQSEVNAKMPAVRLDVQRGIPVPDERITVEQLLRDWLEVSARPSVRASTYACYEANVRLHLVPTLGRTRLVKLAPLDVERLLHAKRAAGLSPNTVRLIRVTLRRALQKALEWGLVARNVADLVSGPTITRKQVQPLTAEQIRTFLAGVKGDELEALYVVAFTLGLRQGEILGLRWQDIDLDADTLRVEQALQRVGGQRQFGPPKSDRSMRALVLPDLTAAALRQHRLRQLEARLSAGERWQDQGLVFTTSIGTPCDPRKVTRLFQAHLKLLGLPHQRFHDARHAAASLLLAQGSDLRSIMEVLGHSQISLTANTYSHLSQEMKRDAAARMDAVFASS
ncbi:MAG: tyrosine-type recombinase/integrase [Dehalococcoidia bacterium]